MILDQAWLFKIKIRAQLILQPYQKLVSNYYKKISYFHEKSLLIQNFGFPFLIIMVGSLPIFLFKKNLKKIDFYVIFGGLKNESISDQRFNKSNQARSEFCALQCFVCFLNLQFQSFAMSDSRIRKCVDRLFKKYASKGSRAMEYNDIKRLLNDAYNCNRRQSTVTDDDVRKFVELTDRNVDGRISKSQMLHVFKRIASTQ